MKKILLTAAVILSACTSSAPANDASLLLIGNKGEDTVSFIDLSSGKELARVPTSQKAPHEIAISPNERFAAVVNYGSADIDIIDIASRTVLHSYQLGGDKNPHGIVWQDDGRIFATTEGGQSMIVIEGSGDWPQRSIQSIATDERGTHMLTVSEDGKRAYTVNLGGGTITSIDLIKGQKIKTVPGGNEPEGIDLAKNNTELWVSARGGNEVYVLDAATLERLETIPVGNFPLRLTISPDGTKAVTSNLLDGSLSVIDVKSRKLERTIVVSGTRDSAQVTILFSEDGKRIYAAETGTDTVAEIDFENGEVLRRLPAGRQGDGLAIVPASPW